MKHLIKFFIVLIVVSFVLTPIGILKASDKEVKKDKVEKHCCSKSMDQDKAKFKVDYKGKTYNLCCEKCKAEFDKDPEKFLKECKDHIAEYCAKHHKVTYVCPMKQCNVKSDKPGKCPKCGMELKKVIDHDHTTACEHKHEHMHEHKHE
jgi:YHS domain-containing protein